VEGGDRVIVGERGGDDGKKKMRVMGSGSY
jgi:hypothetical protein